MFELFVTSRAVDAFKTCRVDLAHVLLQSFLVLQDYLADFAYAFSDVCLLCGETF